MKIVRVTQALYPYIIGGSPVHCHELSNFQSNMGYQVVVMTPKYDSKIEDISINYKIKLFKWYKMPWDFFDMQNPFCPGLWFNLMFEDFDIIHTHSHLFFTTLFSLIIAKIKNKPSVLTVHGVRAVRNKITNFFQEIWLKILSRYIFKLSDKIICLTENDAKEILKYGGEKNKIDIIPNGINTKIFTPKDSDNNFILWAGRFVEEKGLKYLIEASCDIIKTHRDKKFVLVGEGKLEEDIKDKVKKKNLLKNYIFIKNISQSEIAHLMKQCELFVLPSIQEGFPKSLLEAMACAKPIVTTTGLKDIVGNAGITIDPTDVIALKEAIINYINNPFERHKAGAIGRTYVEQNWSWDIVGKNISDLYNNLLKE